MAEPAEDYQAVEKELCRIPDVSAARIVADASGRPVEVHILASPAKHAKQVVRDIQSVAMATFGLELDHRIISVVQLDGLPAVHGESSAPDEADVVRIVVGGVTAVRHANHCSAQVALLRGDEQAVGVAEGLMVSGSELRLVASATLNALRQLEPAAVQADVETATLARLGDRMVAVASVVFLVPPYEEVVAGSAIVRIAGEHDAMVRAVLDATNRRLVQLER
jgi:hypothetical protein